MADLLPEVLPEVFLFTIIVFNHVRFCVDKCTLPLEIYRFNSQSINYTTQCSIFNLTCTIFFYRNGAYTHPSISADPYFQFVNIIAEGFGLGNEQFIRELFDWEPQRLDLGK